MLVGYFGNIVFFEGTLWSQEERSRVSSGHFPSHMLEKGTVILT